MPLAASPEAYRKVIEYGLKKTQLRVDRLLLQAFMAGVYVGMAGHACTTLAGGYSTDPSNPLAISESAQKLLYASIFPTAFIAIIFTGAELFTGNTMTMLICALERRVTFLQLLLNWTCSLVGNWGGALFAAYFLSYLTGTLKDHPHKHYLEELSAHKTSYSFGECFFRGVGCNTFVCLAVWFVTASDDAAGKIIAMWFPIVAFCVAGYEHIIANFYTLQCALLYGVKETVGDVVVKNFIPTLIGNIVGGCGLVGAVYWFNFYPTICYIQEGTAYAPAAVEESAASERKRDLLFNTGGVHTSLLGGVPAPAVGKVNRALTPQSAWTAGGPAATPAAGASSSTVAAAGVAAVDSSRVTSLAPPVLNGKPLSSSGEFVVLPRHSFGGECAYRPAAPSGVLRHPIGSGGGILCKIPSRTFTEAQTPSGQEQPAFVPLERATGAAVALSETSPTLRPGIYSKASNGASSSVTPGPGEAVARYGGPSPAVSLNDRGEEDQNSLPAFQLSVIPPAAFPHVPDHGEDMEENATPQPLLLQVEPGAEEASNVDEGVSMDLDGEGSAQQATDTREQTV